MGISGLTKKRDGVTASLLQRMDGRGKIDRMGYLCKRIHRMLDGCISDWHYGY